MQHLIGETVAVRTYGEPSRDHRGRLIPGQVVDKKYQGCVVYPKGSGYTSGDDVVVTPDFREFTVLFPVEVALKEDDIVVVRGLEMKVQPHPSAWKSPFGTAVGGTEIIARRDEV